MKNLMPVIKILLWAAAIGISGLLLWFIGFLIYWYSISPK